MKVELYPSEEVECPATRCLKTRYEPRVRATRNRQSSVVSRHFIMGRSCKLPSHSGRLRARHGFLISAKLVGGVRSPERISPARLYFFTRRTRRYTLTPQG